MTINRSITQISGMEVRLTVNSFGGKTYSVVCPVCNRVVRHPTGYDTHEELVGIVNREVNMHELHCAVNLLADTKVFSENLINKMHNAITLQHIKDGLL